MRFILRTAFWLGVVLILLPSGGSEPLPPSQVSAGEALTAAKAAVADLKHFCERQPDVCTVGSQTATTLGQRAQAGAKILYEFLNEQFGSEGAPSATAAATGSVKALGLRPSQDTLTQSDVTPAWRGPQPSKTVAAAEDRQG